MTSNRAIGLVVALIVLFGSQRIGRNTSGYLFAADEPPPIPGQEQPEVLTRGPVHEAFAEPVPLQVQAGLIVPKPPPAIIEEVPPADRPQGDHFVWVPGYWSWDADRNDFIWVSACWRVGPPNTYWVPGYWAQVTGDVAAPAAPAGWEWVAGFWAPAGAQEIEYLPAPPAPVDLAPPGAPPAADNMWVPGCWYWNEEQYVRRPGYWLRQQPNWVWEPSHYRWTPRGYVFAAGHWDYSLDRRGVLFAPVYIPPSLYGRAGYSYSPSIAIDVNVLSASLFTYPRYNHYYFGDYYDDAYLNAGIYPQFESDRFHTWADPIYTYDRWHYGQADKQWAEHQQQAYDQRRTNKDLRPARTYREMETRVAKMPEAQRRNFELAKPIQTIAASKANPLKFEKINADAQQKIVKQASDLHKFRDERVKWEATGETNPKAVRPPAETTVIPPPAEHKGPVTPPAEHKEPVPPPAKGPAVTPPVATPPAEHKVPVVTPPAEHKAPEVTPPVEHKVPVVTPPAPAEHKEPVVTPPATAEHKEPVVTPPAPAEHKDPVVTPPAGHTPVLVPPRPVNLTKPEKVKIPVSPPVVGKPGTTPGDVEKGPPPSPIEEQKHKADAKDAPKTDAKDAPKPK